jgi:triacylglycerol esterase/lipase EstA (alpha/beta hydrolase family)
MKPHPSLFKVLAAACTLITAPLFSQVTVGPLEVWSPFQISPTKPRLVVLLHGVTSKVSEAPDEKIGRSGHARHYWGFEFIKGLQGESNHPSMNVLTPTLINTFRARTTVATDWKATTTDTGAFDYAPICFPSNLGPITPAMAQSQSALRTYINLQTNAPNTMVMINTRDGSKHLMPQVAETLEEVFASYKVAFGSLPEARQPQIYLVGHSFGGIIARAILANPTAGDLWGNKLTANQRAMADYIRKRVVLVMTLASPHEGTHIGDPASDVADFISTYGPSAIKNTIAWLSQLSNNKVSKEEVTEFTKESIQTALDAIAGKRDCLQDLHRMMEYNNTILKPNVERRRPNGTLSDLVPIYTAAGRNPGGKIYDQDRGIFILQGVGETYNPIDQVDIVSLAKRGRREAKEAMLLNIIGGVMHLYGYGREGKRPWGTAEAAIGDRFRSPWAGVGPATARGLPAAWFPDSRLSDLVDYWVDGNPYTQYGSDGEWDNDGFLGWDSANAYHLTGQNFYRLYDDTFYGGNLPWDIDNHGNIMFSAANGAWIHNELIREAGPLVRVGARRSVWGPTDMPQTPSKAIRVEVLEMKDPHAFLDTASGADFKLTVRINGQTEIETLEEGDIITDIAPFQHDGIPNTVIPIQISAIDVDSPDHDDICVLSPLHGHSTLYLFYDTRTNKIMGDVQADGGDIIVTKPIWNGAFGSVPHRVDTKIRITQVQPE